MKNILFETPRLIVRRLEESDINDFFEYGSDPYVANRTGFEPSKSLAQSKEILDSFIKDETKFVIELKSEKKVIGGIGLEIRASKGAVSTDENKFKREREIGYVLNQKYHSQGYATEATRGMLKYAFTQLGLFVVRIKHVEPNTQSKRVIEKCGFKLDGIIRHDVIWRFDGQLHHTLIYSMTVDEYKEESKKWH